MVPLQGRRTRLQGIRNHAGIKVCVLDFGVVVGDVVGGSGSSCSG